MLSFAALRVSNIVLCALVFCRLLLLCELNLQFLLTIIKLRYMYNFSQYAENSHLLECFHIKQERLPQLLLA